ncbi:MAG: ECF transporter S component [Chloroflexi bacterium]|nr:ECF transporter S component [Chloroflexota bacterium]MCI0575564.1 ECF transporter S component [Chloroflexota bacterium]MCI0649773.1 ECF transporter S component [Chloroflexota bacterium]MCI0726930.1 ECF transporter S component [Chloroflexota bacterium]
MERIKQDFNTLTIVMIPVAIAINIAIGQLIFALKIPLYLDSIGTVLVAVLAGPWVGALTGLLSNLVWGLSGLNVTYAPFATVAAIIGLVAGLFAEIGWFRRWWRVAIAGLITGLIAAIVSAPISAYVFGGVTGAGTDAVVAIFRGMGFGILPAAFAQGVTSDPLDKLVTFLVVWLIVRGLPARFRDRFPRSENVAEEQM